MASSTTPRTPPPSRLSILIPAVGGIKLKTASSSSLPQIGQQRSENVFFSEMDGAPNVCMHASQRACLHPRTFSGVRIKQQRQDL